MKTLLRRFVACTLMGLAGCTTTDGFNTATDSLSVGELDLATKTFQEVCIGTLPDFSGVATFAQTQGFERMNLPGQSEFGAKTYRTNRKSVLAVTARFDEDTPICGVVFLGPKDRKPVQDAFLETTTRSLGGNPRVKMPAPKNDVAYHLRNKSALIFESRTKFDSSSHYVYFTPPMSLAQAEAIVLK